MDPGKKSILEHLPGIVQTKNINRNKVFCIGLLPESELGYVVITTLPETIRDEVSSTISLPWAAVHDLYAMS